MRSVLFALAATVALISCSPRGESLEEKAKRIHVAAFTVDSHTDTPLHFERAGFDFMQRNDPWESGTKIDLPRMKEGGMDGIWLAVFIWFLSVKFTTIVKSDSFAWMLGAGENQITENKAAHGILESETYKDSISSKGIVY